VWDGVDGVATSVRSGGAVGGGEAGFRDDEGFGISLLGHVDGEVIVFVSDSCKFNS